MGGTVEVTSGCAPVSHRADSDIGAVVLHGFTDNPAAVFMRSVTS